MGLKALVDVFCQGFITKIPFFKILLQEDISPLASLKEFRKHIYILGFQWTDFCQTELKLKQSWDQSFPNQPDMCENPTCSCQCLDNFRQEPDIKSGRFSRLVLQEVEQKKSSRKKI